MFELKKRKIAGGLLFSGLLLLLGGCASGSPYYHGGTSYRLDNVGGLPVSGSVRVSVSPSGVRLSPQLRVSPYAVEWR